MHPYLSSEISHLMPNKIPVRTVFFLSPFSFLLYFVPLSCPHHFDVKILGVKRMTNNNEIIIYQSEDGLVPSPEVVCAKFAHTTRHGANS